jgi:hypothetical protein
MRVWCAHSGVGRAKSYEMLAAQQLRAVKNGRSLLIDIEHGLNYLRSLPPAQIRPRTTPKRRCKPVEDRDREDLRQTGPLIELVATDDTASELMPRSKPKRSRARG